MTTKKENFKLCAWISVLITVVTTLIASRYIEVYQEPTLLQTVHFYVYAAGQIFMIAFFANVIISLGAFCLFSKRGAQIVALIVNLLLLIVFTADTFVFQLYRFHLNWAVIDLFVNGGGEVIKFSNKMWTQIGCIVLFLVILSSIIVWLARQAASKLIVWPLIVLFVFSFAAGNLWHAWAAAAHRTEITWMAEYVPWARPLTMNRFLLKHNLIAKVNDTGEMDFNDERPLKYPLKELTFKQVEKKKNIVFVVVDSLRSDMLNERVMPNLWKIGAESLKFENHYSSGNATRAGIFGLFYGLPPSYWHSALRGKVPSVLISSLQRQGYQIEAFASARLTSPEFDKTVFSSVRNIRINSVGDTSWKRDLDSIKDFEKWVTSIDKPFFSFIFLDNIHAYQTDPTGEKPFVPYWKTVNNLELTKETDPTQYFNLYKNAVYDSDKNIQKIWKILEDKKLLDDTIVVFTSDHGEEFNDNGLNYWGHNGNFTDAQIKIPLVVHWPGRESKVFDHLTTAYDVSATMMTDALGCENNKGDFSVGKSLFEVPEEEWFLCGSYQNTAVVEKNRIVIMNAAGVLEFRQKNYKRTTDTTRTANLWQAIEMMGKYRR